MIKVVIEIGSLGAGPIKHYESHTSPRTRLSLGMKMIMVTIMMSLMHVLMRVNIVLMSVVHCLQTGSGQFLLQVELQT